MNRACWGTGLGIAYVIHDGSGENVWMRQGAHLSRAQSFAPSHQHYMLIPALPLSIIRLARIGLLSAVERPHNHHPIPEPCGLLGHANG